VVAHGGQSLDGTAGEALLQAVYAGRIPTPEQPLRTHWIKGAKGFIAHRGDHERGGSRRKNRPDPTAKARSAKGGSA